MSTCDYKETFEYFRRLKPNIMQGSVLDYGSNYGTFLHSSRGQFPEENYTGIDVDIEALDKGLNRFPKAKFIWYNGYNPVYNPDGNVESIDFEQQYDTIISYSVFTHTSQEDMCNKIGWLYTHLKPGGTILASWLDVDSKVSTDFFYKKRIKDYGSCDLIETSDYTYLSDNRCSKTIEPNIKFLLAFYKKEYLLNLLKDYQPLLANASPDIPSCFQSSMIIRKPWNVSFEPEQTLH
jgi:SAM-dependent methyltransferase